MSARTLIAFCFFLAPLLSAGQQSAPEILYEKTARQLQEIIGSTEAIVGLMAIDLTTGKTFSVNEDLVFPQASAIKIPILMEVFRQANAGAFSLDDISTVEAKNVVGGTGVITTLAPPVSLSIRNLCILMITQSDNTATNTLIDLVGMPAINDMLRSLDLEHTRVQRKMIRPEASARGEENISTPAEAAKILQILYKGEFVSREVSARIIDILKNNPVAHSRLAAGMPPGTPLAFKPGNIPGVATEWAIVLLEERPYAVVVMESYQVKGSDDKVAERLARQLHDYFWRIGNATVYGTYADPELLK